MSGMWINKYQLLLRDELKGYKMGLESGGHANLTKVPGEQKLSAASWDENK